MSYEAKKEARREESYEVRKGAKGKRKRLSYEAKKEAKEEREHPD